jgi:ethanolamine-phosphate phospho-lyase
MNLVNRDNLSVAVTIFISGVVVGASWSRFLSFFHTTSSSTKSLKGTSNKKSTLEKRLKFFCRAQSISYENTNPLMAMKMSMQYVIDDQGIEYLDTRNNVGHVGWQHPRVVQAVQQQTSLCNSNSRYLHPTRALLAEKLLSHFPETNQWCVFFVNSGSEANDLALRLARTHTGNKDAIVVDRAYHGHTLSTLSLSPYKYEHVGGEKYKEDWVHKVVCPDTYRGKFCGSENAAVEYASDVKRACDEACNGGSGVAAFFIESGMSVAGVILPPDGYLKECYRHVRKAGGVCVADEVQTGFGRFGSSFWGFQQQGVVPDIITMGKPFGNGFPLAAVVCKRKVASSFANGLEYFNTFGGNPVACAAGLAVLETIEKENLQDHALQVGNHLMERLRSEQNNRNSIGYKYIGDVRGCGLFIGIELVSNRFTKSPATAETSLLCSKLKDRKILTSIDGRFDNVIVIKPPMCFDEKNADHLVNNMMDILSKITEDDLTNFTHTST